MASDDLRAWLDKVDRAGELRRIDGADWDLELTCFVEPEVSHDMTSAFLFDHIKDYPGGYRVAIPRLVTPKQVALAMDLPECTRMELVEAIRRRLPKWESGLGDYSPRYVESGPVLENVHSGKDVDLFEFPVPKCHEPDGGRYIGTEDAVITRDPDTGEINLGTYRIMAQDRNTAGLFTAPGHTGGIHRRKYHERGEACPVAISVGHHPLLFIVACSNFVGCEYNWAGAIRGEPIHVIKEEVTGLPIPADSEIVIVGWCPPGKERDEGPYGEWTGYYGMGQRPAPIVEIERVYHRNHPILLGHNTGRPQTGRSQLNKMAMDSALIHNELVKHGVPDVRGVWVSDAGLTALVVVSIKQNYAGHAKRAGLIASQSNTLQIGRYVVVVDEDIDPSNIQDVLWAVCFRSDPEKDVDIIRRCRTEPLDPLHIPGTPLFTSVAVIDATIPYERKDNFPLKLGVSPEFAERFREKWGGVLSKER